MSPVILLSIALQIACAVHVVRTGRPLYWIFILLIGSFIGIAIYLIAEVLPGLRHHRAARNLCQISRACATAARCARRVVNGEWGIGTLRG